MVTGINSSASLLEDLTLPVVKPPPDSTSASKAPSKEAQKTAAITQEAKTDWARWAFLLPAGGGLCWLAWDTWRQLSELKCNSPTPLFSSPPPPVDLPNLGENLLKASPLPSPLLPLAKMATAVLASLALSRGIERVLYSKNLSQSIKHRR